MHRHLRHVAVALALVSVACARATTTATTTSTTRTTTTTTTQPAAAPLPPFDIGSWSPGPPPDPGEAAPPVSTPPAPPQGNAVAVLDHKPARRGTKALIVTGIGVAALGIGGAAWRFAHRSSKYWPA